MLVEQLKGGDNLKMSKTFLQCRNVIVKATGPFDIILSRIFFQGGGGSEPPTLNFNKPKKAKGEGSVMGINK